MNEKTQELLNLIRQNPDLEVVPFVNYEICAEDHSYWLGKFGECYVGDYALYNERYFEEPDELKEEYYNQNNDDYEGLSELEIEKILEEKTSGMWKRAIIVYIELPN